MVAASGTLRAVCCSVLMTLQFKLYDKWVSENFMSLGTAALTVLGLDCSHLVDFDKDKRENLHLELVLRTCLMLER